MADGFVGGAAAVRRPVRRLAENARHYRLFAGMWLRAGWQYRVSVVVLTVGQTVSTALDIALIAILFASVPRLGGFSLVQVAFLYGTSYTSFALGNLLFGSAGDLGRHLRAGTLDVMLVRPVGLLTQVAADRFSPRRLGGLAQGVGVLALAVRALPVHWTAARLLLVAVMIGSGVVIFAAIWVGGAALQFVVPESSEALSAFTYGGNYLTQYPLSIFGRDGMVLLTFVLPMAFLNWQPALYVLSRPDPLGLPTAFRFASPLAAALFAGLAGLGWRAGVRRYRGAGG